MKNIAKDFFKKHRLLETSPAKFEYNSCKSAAWNNMLMEKMKGQEPSPEDEETAKLIEEASTANEFFKLMRKNMSALNRFNLRSRLLNEEKEVIDLLKQKSLTSRHSLFIENALYFFLRCEENVSGWVLENYDDFTSDYLKGLYCLIIGFRGDQDAIPFLIKEAERLEALDPQGSLDQGPTLAVAELAERFELL